MKMRDVSVLYDPACVARQCEIGVRKTSEYASVVDGGDKRSLRFLLLFLLALLHLLLQRGFDLRIASVRKVGHFRI